VGLYARTTYNDCVAGNGGNAVFAEFADSGYTQTLNAQIVPFNGLFFGPPAAPVQSDHLPNGYFGHFALSIPGASFIAGHYYAFAQFSCGDSSRQMDFAGSPSGSPFFVMADDLKAALTAVP